MPLAVYTTDQIEHIAAVARAIDAGMRCVLARAEPGVHPSALAALLDEQLTSAGLAAVAVFANVNNVAAHGVPGASPLSRGDVLTLDCVARDDAGWHADLARVVAVGDRQPLPDAAHAVTAAAIGAMHPGGRWREVVEAVRHAAAARGVSLVPGLGGHGVGRRPHERPAAVYTPFDPDRDDFEIRPGLVLTIEPVVCDGPEPPDVVAEPGPLAAVRVVGGRRCACREETVAVTSGGIQVLASGVPGGGLEKGGRVT